jgi:DNA-directed RNA polymerase I, II, and III subunit RPABC5|tara:strand:+ start:219 stop:452 length:234 start_codon:yes stop_codon:yes gene_type:complete
MIIPVKCFTCGTVLADKYRFYLKEVIKKKMANNQRTDRVVYLTHENFDKTPEGEVLDILGLNKICCRRHMLTHVDLE